LGKALHIKSIYKHAYDLQTSVTDTFI